jgi:uncharacterized protein (TIGR03643 family)
MNHPVSGLFTQKAGQRKSSPLKRMPAIIHNQPLCPEETDRIIEMAWEGRTPFEAIRFQFGLDEPGTIALMRRVLQRSSFKRWRKRVNSGVSHKHLLTRTTGMNRFKSNRQRTISMNRISKR